ncbi:uncharacterized protein BDV14DRAFT_196737 [Aspergillus stella-maris]|uniref:uncharacterized protein n=1 Tax=Aspergillus stella-maris TaxID=1810926 RepID=UPI003CCD660F
MADFDFSTTASSVIERWGSSLVGKTVVITGASSGTLGGETAIALASASSVHNDKDNTAPAHAPTTIILLSRSKTKVHPILTSISHTSPLTKTHFIPLNLSDFDSIRAAAKSISQLTGIELTFAINHLGHFLFTGCLMPLLTRAAAASGDGGARVINLTSAGYEMGGFREGDWNFENGKTYNPFSAYAQSKTSNILFTMTLAERYAEDGIRAFAVHPGFIPGTSLLAHLNTIDGDEMNRVSLENTGLPFVIESPKTFQQGVATTLVATLAPDLAPSGSYLADCQVRPVRGYACDRELAVRLWGVSEGLVGGEFGGEMEVEG